MKHRSSRIATSALGLFLNLLLSISLANADAGIQRANCPKPVQSDGPTNPNQAFISAFQATVIPDRRADIAGDVVIRTNALLLQADHATLNFETNTLSLTDNVSLIDQDLCVQGDSATGNFFAGQGEIASAQFFLQQSDLQGSAERLAFVDDQRFAIHGSQITRCPNGGDTWQIASRLVAADRSQRNITIKNMVLRIKDLPVFYLPYLKIPVNQTRQSGFLPLSVARDNRNGIEAKAQYYWSAKPNLDATIGLWHLANRGEIVQAEIRGLGISSRGQLNADFMSRDRLQPVDLSAGNFGYSQADRGMFSLFHEFQHQGFSSAVKFNKASDVNYFRDFATSIAPFSRDLGPFTTDNRERERQLPALSQSIRLAWTGQNLSGHIGYQGFQSLAPQFEGQLRKRPEIGLQYQHSLGRLLFRGIGLVTTSEAQASNNLLFEGRRDLLQTSLAYPQAFDWGFIESTLGFEQHGYHYDAAQISKQMIRYPYATIKAGARLLKKTPNQPLLKVLEPLLKISVGSLDHDRFFPMLDSSQLEPTFDALFQSRGAHGFDPHWVEKSITLGVTHRWINDQTGQQTLALTGGLAHFGAPSAKAPIHSLRQPFYLRIEASPKRILSSQLDLTFDHEHGDLHSGFFNLSYHPSPKAALRVQHRYRSKIKQQFDVEERLSTEVTQLAATLPLGKAFTLRGLWARNSLVSKHIESLVGVSYNGCCWSVETAFRRYYDPQLAWNGTSFRVEARERKGVFLTFELKGLMQIGSDMDKLYREMLPNIGQ